MAPIIDYQADTCRDRWGYPIRVVMDIDLEIDYVRREAVGARHELPCDHVALCPGHHRGTGGQGGYVWATANRELLAIHLRPGRNAARRIVGA